MVWIWFQIEFNRRCPGLCLGSPGSHSAASVLRQGTPPANARWLRAGTDCPASPDRCAGPPQPSPGPPHCVDASHRPTPFLYPLPSTAQFKRALPITAAPLPPFLSLFEAHREHRPSPLGLSSMLVAEPLPLLIAFRAADPAGPLPRWAHPHALLLSGRVIPHHPLPLLKL
jgi:hypothetical protein